MAKIGLQRSGIDALVGQRITAGMPEHVGMHLEANLGFGAGAGEQLGEARRGECTPHATPTRKGAAHWGILTTALETLTQRRGDVFEDIRADGTCLSSAAGPHWASVLLMPWWSAARPMGFLMGFLKPLG